MPVPDFSPGEVLTAAAMDSIGLWLVKSQAVGTGVSSVTITDAFPSAYESFRIVYSGGTTSASGNNIIVTLGASTTGYSEGLLYNSFSAPSFTALVRNNQNRWEWTGTTGDSSTTGNFMLFDLFNPNVARNTFYRNGGWNPNSLLGYATGSHGVQAAYTSFTFGPSSGTITGGTIRVYGYRN